MIMHNSLPYFCLNIYFVSRTIMDTFNSLQGVVIFLLLVVFRRRAIKGLLQESCCLPITRSLVDKLSPHDDPEDQQILSDDNAEVRLN